MIVVYTAIIVIIIHTKPAYANFPKVDLNIEKNGIPVVAHTVKMLF